MNEGSMLSVDIKTTEQLIKKLKRKTYLISKRIIDITISLLGLFLLTPLFIIIIIFIKQEDKGPAFFKQDRIGKNGKIFKLYKFRSMVNNADEILENLLKDPKIKKEYKKKMKLKNDPRITKIGKFLRKTSLDELPQLINILKGEMSLIGNRPYLPREKEDMKHYYKEIVKTKPGLTGYWQVNGRNETTFEERCKLERTYSNNMSFKLDLKIFIKTFYVVLLKKGAQ